MSMGMSLIADHVQQFAHDIEMDSLEPASPGIYELELEDDIMVKITILPVGFSLFSQVFSLPGTNRENFFTQALLANLFGQGTRNAVLGSDDEGKVLTLSKVVEYTPEYKDFKEALEDFVTTVDFWREQIRTHK